MSRIRTRLAAAVGVAAVAALAFSGCASSDPLTGGGESSAPASDTIVIGSQAYYSNEIIAEIYAHCLLYTSDAADEL